MNYNMNNIHSAQSEHPPTPPCFEYSIIEFVNHFISLHKSVVCVIEMSSSVLESVITKYSLTLKPSQWHLL